MKEYYTTKDICKVLSIKADTFRARLRAGTYPESMKHGGKRRFTEKEIAEIIKISKELKEMKKEGKNLKKDVF